MAFAFSKERCAARSARDFQSRVLKAPEPKRLYLQVIVPTDGTGAAQGDERKFRYFLVSTAALLARLC
jgi:hypothetical protein